MCVNYDLLLLFLIMTFGVVKAGINIGWMNGWMSLKKLFVYVEISSKQQSRT